MAAAHKEMENQALGSFGEWTLLERLGSGGFGEVMKWKNTRTNLEIATKSLKDNPALREDEVAKLKQRYRQEYKWMYELKTPYIVRGVDVKDATFLAYLREHHAYPLPVITMEYCNGGDLRNHLQRVEHTNGLHEHEVRQVMHALRHAVEYLHNHCGIKHRDLKPDNVVIQRNGRQCCYKLTDFGFARETSDNTIVQSVVGTRHYFAPEVVDTAQYTKTVDYWSLGVIAFELMCGVLPFIPHQEMFQIITNIKKKPADCIAIKEEVGDSTRFRFERHVFAEHCLSGVFVAKMEQWLRLALDKCYKTRGTAPAQLASGTADAVQAPSSIPMHNFYTELDATLEAKILTVFFLNGYKFLSYEVTPELSLEQLTAALEKDTELSKVCFYFIFPMGHPRPQLSRETRPIDFYVEEWQDTSEDSQNPPVMLYLAGYQCDYNAELCNVPNTLKKCIQLKRDDSVPEWLQQQFERETHFLLSNEQRHLTAFLSGLKDFVLQLEHESFEYNDTMELFRNEIVLMRGCIKQFNLTVAAALKASQQQAQNGATFFSEWQAKCDGFNNEIQKLDANIGAKLKTRYSSARRRIEKEATSQELEQLVKSDIYELADFRHYLQNSAEGMQSVERLEVVQNAVTNCLEKRHRFLNTMAWTHTRNTLNQVQLEFQLIKRAVQDNRKYLSVLENRIAKNTEELMALRYAKPMFSSTETLHELNVDGASNGAPELFSGTPALIEEANRNLLIMQSFMNKDQAKAVKL